MKRKCSLPIGHNNLEVLPFKTANYIFSISLWAEYPGVINCALKLVLLVSTRLQSVQTGQTQQVTKAPHLNRFLVRLETLISSEDGKAEHHESIPENDIA